MSESFVQLAPDSTGKKVRNDQLDVGQQDGTIQPVNVQVVRLAERDQRLLQEIRDLLRRQFAVSRLMLSALDRRASDRDIQSLLDKLSR